MTAKTRRLFLTFGALMVLGLAVFLVLSALKENIVYFYSPQILKKHICQPSVLGSAVW